MADESYISLNSEWNIFTLIFRLVDKVNLQLRIKDVANWAITSWQPGMLVVILNKSYSLLKAAGSLDSSSKITSILFAYSLT